MDTGQVVVSEPNNPFVLFKAGLSDTKQKEARVSHEMLRDNLLLATKNTIADYVVDENDVFHVFDSAMDELLTLVGRGYAPVQSYAHLRKEFSDILEVLFRSYLSQLLAGLVEVQHQEGNMSTSKLMHYFYLKSIGYLKNRIAAESTRWVIFMDSFSELISIISQRKKKFVTLVDLRKYFFGILRNKIKEDYRKSQREKLFIDQEEDVDNLSGCMDNSNWLSATIRNEQVECLEIQLGKLQKREQEILLSHFGKGKKHKDIAQFLNLSTENCRKICSRSFTKIKDLVEKFCS